MRGARRHALLAALLAVFAIVAFWHAGRGNVTLHIHNGLGRTVQVTVDDRALTLPPLTSAQLAVRPGRHDLLTRTAGGTVIESFAAVTDGDDAHWVYNIAGAAPLVLTAGGREQRLGLARWSPIEADSWYAVTTDPGTGRHLLDIGHLAPREWLGLAPTADDQLQLALRQARWAGGESPHAREWLALVSARKEFRTLRAQRLQDDPGDPLLQPAP